MTTRRSFMTSALVAALAATAAAPAMALNPQPLPPKEKLLRGDRSLSPQPLPPKEKLAKRRLRR